jgi:hypothetical protein
VVPPPLHSHCALSSSLHQGPLVFLLVLSVSGKIALTTQILEAKYHGTLAKIHSGNSRFGLYPFFLSAVVPPASQFADISSLLSHRANRFASFGHGYHQYSGLPPEKPAQTGTRTTHSQAYHAPYHHRMASCRPSDCMHHCLPCRILALHNPMACMCIFSSHIVDLKCQTDNALG